MHGAIMPLPRAHSEASADRPAINAGRVRRFVGWPVAESFDVWRCDCGYVSSYPDCDWDAAVHELARCKVCVRPMRRITVIDKDVLHRVYGYLTEGRADVALAVIEEALDGSVAAVQSKRRVCTCPIAREGAYGPEPTEDNPACEVHGVGGSFERWSEAFQNRDETRNANPETAVQLSVDGDSRRWKLSVCPDCGNHHTSFVLCEHQREAFQRGDLLEKCVEVEVAPVPSVVDEGRTTRWPGHDNDFDGFVGAVASITGRLRVLAEALPDEVGEEVDRLYAAVKKAREVQREGRTDTAPCTNPYCVDGWVPYQPNPSGGAPASPCKVCRRAYEAPASPTPSGTEQEPWVRPAAHVRIDHEDEWLVISDEGGEFARAMTVELALPYVADLLYGPATTLDPGARTPQTEPEAESITNAVSSPADEREWTLRTEPVVIDGATVLIVRAYGSGLWL